MQMELSVAVLNPLYEILESKDMSQNIKRDTLWVPLSFL